MSLCSKADSNHMMSYAQCQYHNTQYSITDTSSFPHVIAWFVRVRVLTIVAVPLTGITMILLVLAAAVVACWRYPHAKPRSRDVLLQALLFVGAIFQFASGMHKGIYLSGAAKLSYRAFYDKSMKFGMVIPWTISVLEGEASWLMPREDFDCYGYSHLPSNNVMPNIVLIIHQKKNIIIPIPHKLTQGFQLCHWFPCATTWLHSNRLPISGQFYQFYVFDLFLFLSMLLLMFLIYF